MKIFKRIREIKYYLFIFTIVTLGGIFGANILLADLVLIGENQKIASPKLSKDEIVKIAHSKLKSMGHQAGDYKYLIEKTEDIWSVQYLPLPKPGIEGTLGGGFEIKIKEDGTVVEVVHLQ